MPSATSMLASSSGPSKRFGERDMAGRRRDMGRVSKATSKDFMSVPKRRKSPRWTPQKSGQSRKGMSAAGPGWSASASRAASARRRASITAGGKAYTVGVLAQCNTGDRKVLRIAGAPVGQAFTKRWLPCFDPKHRQSRSSYPKCGSWRHGSSPDQGSIIIVVGTDAPLMPLQLEPRRQAGGAGSRPAGLLFRQRSSGDFIFSLLDRRRRGQPCRARQAQHRSRRWPNSRLESAFRSDGCRRPRKPSSTRSSRRGR